MLAPVEVLASRIRFEEKRILDTLERRRIPHRVHDVRTLVLAPERCGRPWAVALNHELALTRARYAAAWLDRHGVRAINDLAAIETCGDKVLTTMALARAGIRTPRTRVALGVEAALVAAEELGYPVVLKPAVGSWGRLCARLRDRETAEALLDHRQALPNPQQHVHYLQEYVDGAERDIRVIVVGQRVLGAMQRRGRDWRCNAARGARGVALQTSEELRLLALAAARAVDGDVVGVDLITDRNGAHHVLEVNHGVEFREFEAVTGVDVAGAIVDHAVAAAATTVEAAA